jgi:hypothetical protein
LFERRVEQVSQIEAFSHEKVAWIYVSIVLNDEIAPALLLKGA